MLKTYCYACPDCGVFDLLVEYDDRDQAQSCPDCNSSSPRTWAGAGPAVLQVALPDGTRRFDRLRIQRRLERAKAEAKRDYDHTSYHKVNREIQRFRETG